MPDVLLKAADAVAPQHEPQLQTPEAATQGDAPMSIVDGGVRVAVLEVQGIHDQGGRQPDPVSHPHCGTIEVGQQPFVRVGVEGVGVFDSGQQVLQFRADEGVARISTVHV